MSDLSPFTPPPIPPIFRASERAESGPSHEIPGRVHAMRAETQTLADEIKQSLALLRRHL
tara:strand:- start:31070 stop:31249 length:180 start_codon:yes stop_codon:yes gene_type:complete